jgi:putative PIN family toxin of toxin-antitoxin system
VRAVFDANVFVSAALCPEGIPGRLVALFLGEQPPFELIVTPAIVAEVERAFTYPRVRRYLKQPVDEWLDDLLLLAELVEDSALAAPASDDPDDDKYLAAALSGRAAVVVTGDDDLLRLKRHEGVRILSPRAFLRLIESK